MQPARPAFAAHPSAFGRGPVRTAEEAKEFSPLSQDLKLFALTFLGRVPVRLNPDWVRAQSQARCSFQPSHAETRHIAATSNSASSARRQRG